MSSVEMYLGNDRPLVELRSHINSKIIVGAEMIWRSASFSSTRPARKSAMHTYSIG
jgi:hypothetical protein